MGLIKESVQRTFVTISGDGELRVQSQEGVQDAVKREGEDSKGNKFEKWELLYKKLSGIITGISLFEGDYGQNLLIDLRDEDDFTLSVGVATQFGEDLLKRLPGVNLKEEVTFAPYAIVDEQNPKYKNKGVAVYQSGGIVKNAYWDGTKELNGYPQRPADWDKKDIDDKKYFYGQCRKHTIKFLEENIMPEVNSNEVIKEDNNTTTETIDLGDVKFE